MQTGTAFVHVPCAIAVGDRFARYGACVTNARLLRPPQIGIFLRSFPLNRPTLFAGNDRRKLLDLGRPRYGDH
jgi:hypothetical protein